VNGTSLVHSLLDEAVADAPGSTAVRDRAGAWTYAELAAWSHAVEVVLARRGVRRGDRVVVQLPTTRELVALFFGTTRRGAVFVPVNPAM
jgi:acyl-CoA synthetase (AMP-forming)/AMP-acid ligase II